jgi:hypothetical protein
LLTSIKYLITASVRKLKKEPQKSNASTSSLLVTSRMEQVQFLWYLAVKNEVKEKMKAQELGLRR